MQCVQGPKVAGKSCGTHCSLPPNGVIFCPRDVVYGNIHVHVFDDSLLTRFWQCDGARPKCLGCTELGFDCTYVNSVSSSNVIVGKDYLSTLENRLQAVEEYIGCLKGSHGKRQQQLRFDDDPRSVGRSDADVPSPSVASLANEDLEIDSDSLQDSSGLGNDADGMGAMVFSTEVDCGFFGTYRWRPLPMHN